jgi:hypothetical protein
MVKKVLATLFPAPADNVIHGMRLPVAVFGVIAAVSTARSCIHLLAPDGGAGSIAGMDLSAAGASGIVFAFALWGSAQLVYALIQLLVLVRYRSLVPLMYVLLILETLLREWVGRTKPVTFAHTAPGAIANQVMLPLAVVMLALSLWSGARAADGADATKKPGF